MTVVAEAALEAGLDYLDPQFSRAKVAALQKMAARIQAAGRCFITDAGFHPGLPAALVRYAATRFDRIQTANVGSVIPDRLANARRLCPRPWMSSSPNFAISNRCTRDGGWRPMGWAKSFRPVWMTFGHDFGRRYTMPMFLEELRTLPDNVPGLEETGFFVGGFNWFVDWVIMPLGMAWMAVAPKAGARAFGRMLAWGLRRFQRPAVRHAAHARGARDCVRGHALHARLGVPPGWLRAHGGANGRLPAADARWHGAPPGAPPSGVGGRPSALARGHAAHGCLGRRVGPGAAALSIARRLRRD